MPGRVRVLLVDGCSDPRCGSGRERSDPHVQIQRSVSAPHHPTDSLVAHHHMPICGKYSAMSGSDCEVCASQSLTAGHVEDETVARGGVHERDGYVELALEQLHGLAVALERHHDLRPPRGAAS
eukprot:SAG31_NODE_574_length_13967_cov_7.512042_4_plen_124_part_00